MGYLCVKDSAAVDSVRVDQCRAVLAEIVENLDDIGRGEDLLQVVLEPVVEGVDFQHIKEIGVALEAELEQCDRLVLGEALAVDAQDRRGVACLDSLAELLDIRRTFYESVAFGWLFEVSL